MLDNPNGHVPRMSSTGAVTHIPSKTGWPRGAVPRPASDLGTEIGADGVVLDSTSREH